MKEIITFILVFAFIVGSGISISIYISTNRENEIKASEYSITYDEVVESITPAQHGEFLIQLGNGKTFKAQIGNSILTIGKKNHIVVVKSDKWNYAKIQTANEIP